MEKNMMINSEKSLINDKNKEDLFSHSITLNNVKKFYFLNSDSKNTYKSKKLKLANTI